MPALAELSIGDPPALWSELGFAVVDGVAVVGDVALRFDTNGRGLLSWGCTDLPAISGDGRIDGLPTVAIDAGETSSAGRAGDSSHRNGVRGLDHVVVHTPDLDRTLAAFAEAGFALRRVRSAYGGTIRQAFFQPRGAIVEVVGPAQPTGSGGPARLFGLAFTVADLDATAAFLGDRLGPPKPAVQPGRQIATLTEKSGSSVPVVMMSPHVPHHRP